jgi:type IX secretion system PorP/SprF family membrane protein
MQTIKLLFFFCVLSGAVMGQNPRLSMYEASPLHVNPAYTGKFMGRIRGGVHASFQNTDSANSMHTTAFVDYSKNYDPDQPEPRKNIGVGLQYYRYGGGNLPISASFISLSGAYHRLIDRRGRHYGGVGLQATYASGQLNRKPGDYYDKEISGGGFRYRPGDSPDSVASHSYTDFAIGIYYGYRTAAFRFETGLSMYHLFYPANDIFQLDPDVPKLRHRGVFNMKFDFDLTEERTMAFKSMYWADGLYWLSTSFDSDNLVAFWTGLELIKRGTIDNAFNIDYGIHSRNFRTIMPMVSVTYNRSFNIRASYEMPVNSKTFQAYSAKRAEIALIIKLDMKGKVLPYTED